jgi:cation diffusion facilitator family transporter
MAEPLGEHHDVSDHHDHGRPHDHEHDHAHGDAHTHEHGFGQFLRSLFVPHSHDVADSLDKELEASRDGVRAVAICLVILLVTSGLQALVVVASGSVALLGDTLHNAADALTAVPLWLAFRLGRRPPTRRFTYGLGKSEDLAGVAVVAIIALSAGFAAYEAVERLLHPEKITHLPIVMIAAVVGAVGNEVVAQYRVRVGRRIGSAALEADGLHARTDGITSLLVLVGAIAVACGLHWADAVVGLVISLAILLVLVRTVRSVGQRLLDAVDPAIIDHITKSIAAQPGVDAVSEVRARWVGHRLFAQVRMSVDGSLTVIDAHQIAEAAYHQLLHDVPNLSDAIVHVDPVVHGVDPHAPTAHHRATH